MASKAIDFAPRQKLSEQVVIDVLLRVAEGETLKAIYASDPERLPHPATWLDWVEQEPAIALAYARAKEGQADALAEGCLEVANDATDDVEIGYHENGQPYARINGHTVQRAKLIIDTRLKLLSKWHHVKYGDKLLHAGYDGGAIKTETLAALPDLVERMRNARKAGRTAAEAVIDQPPAVTHAGPSPMGRSGPRAPEPGDPGMEFV